MSGFEDKQVTSDHDSGSYFMDLPIHITPIYNNSMVNKPLSLYDGKIDLEQASSTISGTGSVQFVWLPHPRVRFSFESDAATQASD